MRIIFLGHCSFNVITNLTDAIKKNSKDIEISVVDITNSGGEITEDEFKIFDEVLNLPLRKNVKYGWIDKFNTTVNLLKDNFKRRLLIKNLILLRLNSLKKYINYETEEKIYSKIISNFFVKYDIFHFHYVAPGFLRPLKYIDKNKKIILSIWGSDLFQIAGVDNYKQQLEAFERADIITINTNSIESIEIFLSKFGRHLTSKVRLAFFGLPEKKFNQLESKKKSETILKFKKKYDIKIDKIIITIGYNATSKQKHMEILKILDSLDPMFKKKFHAIIPMTYGLQLEEKNYLDKVKDLCQQVGFSTTILTEYMSLEVLSEFTIASEIKLNLRETDLMNAAMLESFYAGNLVVNGAWLPYGKLRRLGVYYKEIEDLSELKILIPHLLENFECEKKKASGNSKLIRDFFISNNTIKDWIKIYNELATK